MKNKIIELIENSLKKLNIKQLVELTPAKGHGDFSSNIAMKCATQLGVKPVEIANKIIENIEENSFIEKIEVAGPGFINLFINSDSIINIVNEIIKKGSDFGKGSQTKYINLEYVSANPTGYLHVGHARSAAIGSSLVNILRFSGNKVDAEYYINDAGSQIKVLGESLRVRYLNILGNNIKMPEVGYKGVDIKIAAQELFDIHGNSLEEKDDEYFGNIGKVKMLDVIKEHLSRYKVEFDLFSSEQKIYDDNLIAPALEKLKNFSYIQDGALWLKTTAKGDDKDRVLIKSDKKTYTYFTPDIAYHNVKISRGYDELINIFGADHIGYIKRMEVALEFLGLPSNKLDIFVVELVKLMKDGQEVKMSKRMGTSYTLVELMNEVGVDAARWFMIDRTNSSSFVFDINESKKQSSENPVFSVQYSHARANQLLIKSGIRNAVAKDLGEKEKNIVNHLGKFGELIEIISNTHKVHLLPNYLLELSRIYNSWYTNNKAIGMSNEESLVALNNAVKIVINNGLTLLGINAPNEMK